MTRAFFAAAWRWVPPHEDASTASRWRATRSRSSIGRAGAAFDAAPPARATTRADIAYAATPLDSIAAATGLHELQHIRVVNGRMADVSALLADDLRAWNGAGARRDRRVHRSCTATIFRPVSSCCAGPRGRPRWTVRRSSRRTQPAAKPAASAGWRADEQPFAARNVCSGRNSRSRRWRDRNVAYRSSHHETGD